MVLTSPGALLTQPPSSSPPKTPIRSYSVQTLPRNENPTPPPPDGHVGGRLRWVTGGQIGPQANADALRHPRHSATALIGLDLGFGWAVAAIVVWDGVWGFWSGPWLVRMQCVILAATLLWGGRLLAA
jgi:hypothetical protein